MTIGTTLPALPVAAREKRGTREGSRARLLDAAEWIIRHRGVSAVTTVSVTTAAGFAQSAFYLHFKNVEECLRVAGERIAQQLRQSVAEERRRMQRESLGDFNAELQFYHFVLGIFDQRGTAEIILKNRFDPTPLGKVIANLVAGLRKDLADDLWSVAGRLGLELKYRPRSDILADFLLSNVWAAAEAFIEGRVTDRELLASQLTMTMKAACADLFQYCSASGVRAAS